MIGCSLNKVVNNSENLSEEDYYTVLDGITANRLTGPELITFLSALSSKTLAIGDVVPFVKFVHKISPVKRLNKSDEAINIVGTGGGLPTFNISTTAAFVASAAGATVLKSGSYAYSSRCGSIEVLKALGIDINVTIEKFEQMLDEIAVGFVNPQFYTPLLRRIAVTIYPRTLKSIGGYINTLGPLICPFKVKGQLTGVNSPSTLLLMGHSMKELNFSNSAVCWAEIGIDELSSIGNNYVLEVGTETKTKLLKSDKFSFRHSRSSKLKGGDATFNAEITRQVLTGNIMDERRETVALNSAYVLLLAQKVNDIAEGIEASCEAIDTGKAYRRLQEAIEYTRNSP